MYMCMYTILNYNYSPCLLPNVYIIQYAHTQTACLCLLRLRLYSVMSGGHC
jgi:hypothetical protein